MERKLIKQGGGGYTIYLPKKWIDKNNLTASSRINVQPQDNNLIITTQTEQIKTKTDITLLTLTESSIRTLITNTYRRGFDEITIHYDNEEQFNILKQTIKTKLIGFEVTKKEKYFCIVESVTEPSQDQFKNLLSKIFYNITELFEITKKKLNNVKEQYNDELDFEETEARIQRYDNFCRRVISKQTLQNKNSELLWTFLTLIIHGQRELYHLNKELHKELQNKKASFAVIELFEKTNKIFNLVRRAYFEKQIELLSQVHELEKELVYHDGYNLLKKNKEESNIIYHLMFAAREFYQSNSPLSGIFI